MASLSQCKHSTPPLCFIPLISIPFLFLHPLTMSPLPSLSPFLPSPPLLSLRQRPLLRLWLRPPLSLPPTTQPPPLRTRPPPQPLSLQSHFQQSQLLRRFIPFKQPSAAVHPVQPKGRGDRGKRLSLNVHSLKPPSGRAVRGRWRWRWRLSGFIHSLQPSQQCPFLTGVEPQDGGSRGRREWRRIGAEQPADSGDRSCRMDGSRPAEDQEDMIWYGLI